MDVGAASELARSEVRPADADAAASARPDGLSGALAASARSCAAPRPRRRDRVSGRIYPALLDRFEIREHSARLGSRHPASYQPLAALLSRGSTSLSFVPVALAIRPVMSWYARNPGPVTS
jgi:hypothetical protein